MAKIELTEETKLTTDMIAALKPFAGEDGVLDTDFLKTAKDVDTVMRSKKNADKELTDTKKMLTDAQAILKGYTDAFGEGKPDEIKTELETYRNTQGDKQAELIRATQSSKEWERKFHDLKKETDPMRERIKQADARDYSDRLDAIWQEKKKSLDPKWSKKKADVIFKSAKEKFKIAENDPKDFAEMANGQGVMDYIVEQLELIDGYETFNGGHGNPGNGRPQNGPQPLGMFEAAAAQIHF